VETLLQAVAAADYRKRALAALAHLPPFSPILQKLLATLARDNVSYAELAQIIEKDTVLAGNVLRIVNSALYGRRATISSVAHAISILGLSKLRNYALGMSISSTWSRLATPKGWSALNFNLHSVGTAILADYLALRVSVHTPESAFAAGLFHDLGKLLIAISLPDEFSQIYSLHQDGEGSIEACERAVLSFDHAELSVEAVNHWHLPTSIGGAVAGHHQVRPRWVPPPPHELAAVVGVASDVVAASGFPVEPCGGPVTANPMAEFHGVLPKDVAQEGLEMVKRELEILKGFI
jgi:HD-like signal output (HDOD) protein